MEYDLTFSVLLSRKIDMNNFIEAIKEKLEDVAIKKWWQQENKFFLRITSEKRRAHEWALRIYKMMAQYLGKEKIGVRDIHLEEYIIKFELEKKSLKKFSIPFAELNIKGKNVEMKIFNKEEEFMRKNYIDRMIKLVKEKVEKQYYEGKKEYWQLLWKSEEKEPIWNKDPSIEMQKLGWIVLRGKGKWFYFPPAAAIMRAMEKIVLQEIILPLGFKEVIEPMHVPFETWLKTGHLEGMPSEIYYICEPFSRDEKEWERFIDLVKIMKKVDEKELLKNLKAPKEGVVYAQCPNIYASMSGKTIAEEELPLLIFEHSVPSDRYEAGGKHGIERVDEFHRIEIVYIGTKEQLLDLREKLIARYNYVFNNILDLEWRMARVTPFYMQQAGIVGTEENVAKGTIDFEAWLPYRGDRRKEWLEFQNISIVGDKYTKAFNIKGQRSQLWSGCSGVGLERWMVSFLAQKGLNPENWPDAFKKYLHSLPEMPKFL